ncbi:WAT1-related protein At5g07050-like [Nymphaea colorata]|nr:WAT1-related protein At5g07050-like [Nymphaea colorata]
MEGQSCCSRFLQASKPYVGMISLQFGYAGMNIITKVSLNRGFSHYVLVVYRHAFATAAMAPFALLLERKVRPQMTLSTFMLIFVLGALGPVIDQNFYYAGLKFTSPTFSCAMSNILPALTFVMAVLCRMEKVHLKKLRSQAKVVGTLVTVAGAMLMTLYKGPIVELPWARHAHEAVQGEAAAAAAAKDWVKGSIFLIIACLAWAAFFILQVVAMRRYPAQLSLTTLICFVGTLQSIAVTMVMERSPSVWKIGFDLNLLAAAYAGIIASGVAYYVQGLVMEKKGPVFATAFSPLMMIIVAILGSFILKEVIYLGGILGAILIVAGLYSVLWGKYKDSKAAKAAEISAAALPVPAKADDEVGETDDIDMNDMDLEKAHAAKISSIDNSLILQMSEQARKPNQAPLA